jgi:multiple sugar transport system permease protein
VGRGRAQADLRGLSRAGVVLARPGIPRPVGLTRFLESERLLALGLLAPAVALLGVFVAYPFVVGVWLSLSDTSVGHPGHFVGLANFASAWQDSIFRTAFANTLFYTFWATLFKLALGMWLAILLNRSFRGNRVVRAAVLLPFIVPTVLSTFAWRWMFDPSVLNWLHFHLHVIENRLPFLSDGTWALWGAIVVNTWRGMPFFGITLLAGLQTISPELHEAASLDGANGWQRFRGVTWPLLRQRRVAAHRLAAVDDPFAAIAQDPRQVGALDERVEQSGELRALGRGPGAPGRAQRRTSHRVLVEGRIGLREDGSPALLVRQPALLEQGHDPVEARVDVGQARRRGRGAGLARRHHDHQRDAEGADPCVCHTGADARGPAAIRAEAAAAELSRGSHRPLMPARHAEKWPGREEDRRW